MAYKVRTKREHIPRSGIALGGIGAGWFELRQDGQTYDWNIFNNRPTFTGPSFPFDSGSMLFFKVRYQEDGCDPKIKLLQLENKYGGGGVRQHEHYYIVPWMSGVDCIDYEGSFPFIRMKFKDDEMPFTVELEAWSPFIPHDVKNSSLPVGIFQFRIRSKSKRPVKVMIVGSMRNAVAYDVEKRIYTNRICTGEKYSAVEMSCENVMSNHFSMGNMGLSVLDPAASSYLGWEHHHPYYELLIRETRLAGINDTEGRNPKNGKTGKAQAMEYCFSSIASSGEIRGKKDIFCSSFVASWWFPNLYGRDVNKKHEEMEGMSTDFEGHYYTNFFSSSTEVAAYVADNLDDLRARTRAFQRDFFKSSAPKYLLDQVNSNLNQYFCSSWLNRKGQFGLLEGLNSEHSFAGLCTTDVAMYGSVSYASLFPELAKQVIRDYGSLQGKNGKIAHSLFKNFHRLHPRELNSPRLDMPGQYAFMALRNYLWTGDMEFLKELWPSVRKAIEYVLRERDMNGDGLPDMEGVMCSYDNFPMYGLAPYVAGQFLAALKLASEAASVLGKKSDAERYGQLFQLGRKTLEDSTWNGKYYRLSDDREGQTGTVDEGCLTDQLIGQWALRQVGYGPLFDPGHMRIALKNIMKMNFKPDYGLRNCQWPGDKFLHDVDKDTWVDQANTCWTGVELGFASLLIYEGLVEEAMTVVRNVDDRYRKWGLYWDHQEFGGRYFRPMSSWALINALAGLEIQADHLRFAPRLKDDKNLKLFFSCANGWGHYLHKHDSSGQSVELKIRSGFCGIRKLSLKLKAGAVSALMLDGARLMPDAYSVRYSGGILQLEFPEQIKISRSLRAEFEI